MSELARKRLAEREAERKAEREAASKPTVPTVSTTVGSHTSDYGKVSGSKTEEPEKKWYQKAVDQDEHIDFMAKVMTALSGGTDPADVKPVTPTDPVKQDLAKQLAEAEEKWKQAQLDMDKNLYSEDLAGYKKAVDLAKANYEAIRKQMEGTEGEKEYGSVWELLADPDAHKSGLEDLKEATKEGWDALWGRNERGQKFWGGLTKANDVYGTKLEEDKQAIANAAKSEYKDEEATGWEVTGDTVMTGIAGINKMFTGTLDFLMPTEFLGKYDPFTYLSDVAKRDYTYYDAKRAAALDGKGKVAEFASEAGVAAVQAIPQAVMAVLSAGTSAAPTLAAGGAQATSGLAMTLDSAKTALSTMLQNPSYYVSVASTLGNDYEEAKAKGASDAQAAVYAIITSGINAGIEVSGGIETLPKELQGADGHALLKWVLSMPEEGLEELYQGAVSGGMEKAIFNPDKEIASKTNEDAIFHPGTMAKEFALGTAVGGLLGAPQVGAYAIGNKVADNRVAKVGESYTGTKEELIEEGLSFGEGYDAYKVAKELQQKVDAGEEISSADIGRAVIAINQSTRTDLKNALANFDAVTEEESSVDTSVDTSEASPVQSRVQTIQTRLAESGMDTAQAEVVAQSLSRILDGDTTVTNADKNVLSVDNRVAREVFEAETGVKLPSSNASTRKTVSEYIAQTAMKKQRETGVPDISVGNKPDATISKVETVTQPVQQDATVDKMEAVPQLKAAPEATTDAKTTLHQAAINAVVGQAKADMNTLGANGKRVYQKHIASAPDVGAYTNAFQRYYDAGAIGLDFVDLKTAYDRGIPRDVLYEAYAAGVNDATPKFKDNSPADKKDAQKGKNQPFKGKGKVLDYRSREGKESNTVAEKDMKALKVFAKVFRVDIEIVDTIANEDGVSIANGYYAAGKVTIAADSYNPIMTVLKHEVTHHIQRTNPAQYKAFKDYVMKAYYNNDPDAMNAEIKRRIALAKYNKVTLTRSEAMDEIVADATERFLTDRDSIDALVRENRTLGETILNAIRDVLRKVEAAMKGEKIGTGGAFLNADQLKKAEKMWVEALNGTLDAEVGVNSVAISESSGPIWSMKSMKFDLLDGKMQRDLVEHGIMTEEESLHLMSEISKLIDDMSPFAHIVDMNEEYTKDKRPFAVYKPNSDPLYKVSLDFSTLCKKRLMTQFVMESLQTKLGKALSAKEQMAIRSKLEEYAKTNEQIQVACALCYVEARRLKAPDQINRFLNDRTTILTDYFGKKNSEYKKKVEAMADKMKVELGYKADTKLKDMKLSDKKKVNEAKRKMMKEYTPSAEEQKIIERANAIDNAEFLSQAGLTRLNINEPAIYDAFVSHVRNATKSKALEGGVPYYYGDSKSVSDALIEAMNAENGLRHQSWSDFEIVHLLDTIAAVIDLSVRKAKVQSYTKVPGFVHVNGNTGMMINLSLIPAGKNGMKDGKLDFSPTEGMDYSVAVDLRDQYHKTTGTIAIGIDDAQIEMLLNDDTIDYVIPYHTSGMNKELRKMAGIAGWLNYESYQSEKEIKGAKQGNVPDALWHKKPDFSEWFDTSKLDMSKSGVEIMREAAGRYLVLCEERGLKPKFSDTKQHTDFSKHENYWKLLIDRKMVDGDGNIIIQQAVRPNFDFGKISEVVNAEIKAYDPTLLDSINDLVMAEWENGGIKQREAELLKEEKAKKKAAKVQNGLLEQAVKPEGQYSFKDGIESGDYTTSQIDWAIDNEVISKKNKADLIRTIDNEIYRGYTKGIRKDKNGNYIVESGNVMMFTNGDRHDPSLDMVVVLDDEYETLMFDAKEEIYNGAKAGDVHGAAKVIEGLYWSGYATVHVPETYRANEGYGRRGKRSLRQILEDETGEGRIYSLKDSDYMDAVNRGKKKKAQQMVDEAAVEAGVETGPDGKPIALYHGTPNFGFTTIDTKFSDDSLTFWATSDVSVAESYLRSDFDPKHKEARREIGNPKTESNDAKLDRKKHSEEAIVAAASVLYPEYKRAVHTDEEKLRVTRKDVKRAKKYGKELISSGVFTGENLQTLERFVDAVDAKTLENLANATKDVTLGFKDLRQEVEWNEKYDDLLEKFIDTVSDIEPFTKPGWIDSIGNAINIDKLVQNYNRNEGVYKLFYKAQTPFVLDCKGRAWNKISAPATMQTASSTVTTRDVARWAYERGYDSVKFENAVDMGSKNAKRTPATVWCFMNPKEQLWSADPVTYDDAGNVIPLSERFNAEKEDIRYQFKTPPELLELSEKIAAEEHKAKAVTDADIMSQALNAIAKTEEEKSVVRNYQNAMKKLAAYEKDLAVYDAQKGEHEKGRSIYTDASGKVKKSGVKYSAEEKAEIQRKIELWKRNLKDIERKEAFQKVLKREKAKMAETHAKKMSDLREAYNKRLDALREQRDAKVDAEKQKMRDYKQHQRDSKAYRELKAKLEADVKWLGDRLVHPTDAKHIPEDFKKVVAKFLESLDFTTKGMDERIAKTGEPSKNYIKMWSMIEAYQEIANDDSSNIELTPIEDAMLKSLKETFEDNRRVEDLNYEELNMVYDMIRWIKTGVASANRHFNENIKETVSENGDAAIEELSKRDARKEFGNEWVREADKLLFYDNVTPGDMFRRFGGVLEKMYGEIRKGFNKHIENVRSAIDYTHELIKGHEEDVKKWSNTADVYQLSNGNTIELTQAQVMSLYCLMKREQAVGHVLGSGIVPSGVVIEEARPLSQMFKKEQKAIKKENMERNEKKFSEATVKVSRKIAEHGSQLTPEDVQNIIKMVEENEDMKRIADGIVKFFTTKCADWGNEASMKMFDTKKFTEKNYFPIKSSDAFLAERFDEGGDPLIRKLSFTHNTVVNASNPIVIDDIFNVYTDHVNKMSMYNALVVPLTDFTKVYNYKQKDAEGRDKTTVHGALAKAHGSLATDYVERFIKDVNKSANTLAAESFGAKNLARFKKAKIGMNLRVLIQQPTSIVRATAMVDPKYILAGLKQKANYEELFENSEIAFWKSEGFFETDTARSMKDIIMGNEKWLDKVTMGLYGKADDFAWGHLWNAIKLEQADANPDMDTTSSEFMDLVKARFEEVVDRTQVVDTPLHRSHLMRSKSVYVKMVTAFMAEPTKGYNLLMSDFAEGKKTKNYGKFKRSLAAYVASAAMTAWAAAWVDALRDDEDEDEEGNKRGFITKQLEATLENMLDNIVPMNLVPYAKDIYSTFKGYDVTRTDMASYTNFSKAMRKVLDPKYNWPYKARVLTEAVADVFGVPLKNALRDITAITESTGKLLGGDHFKEYTKEKRRYDISNSDNRSKFYKHYTDAVLAGDEKGADAILSDMVVNGIPYDNIIAKGYQAEKKVAFAEAQKLIDAGKDTEAREVIRQLAKKYDKKFSTLWKAVKADEPDVPEETYDFDDLQKAVKKGQDTELIEDYLTKYGGYSEEAMEEAIKMLTEKYK